MHTKADMIHKPKKDGNQCWNFEFEKSKRQSPIQIMKLVKPPSTQTKITESTGQGAFTTISRTQEFVNVYNSVTKRIFAGKYGTASETNQLHTHVIIRGGCPEGTSSKKSHSKHHRDSQNLIKPVVRTITHLGMITTTNGSQTDIMNSTKAHSTQNTSHLGQNMNYSHFSGYKKSLRQ